MCQRVLNVERLSNVVTDECRRPRRVIIPCLRRRRRQRRRQFTPPLFGESGGLAGAREVAERGGIALGDDIKPVVDRLFGESEKSLDFSW